MHDTIGGPTGRGETLIDCPGCDRGVFPADTIVTPCCGRCPGCGLRRLARHDPQSLRCQECDSAGCDCCGRCQRCGQRLAAQIPPCPDCGHPTDVEKLTKTAEAFRASTSRTSGVGLMHIVLSLASAIGGR